MMKWWKAKSRKARREGFSFWAFGPAVWDKVVSFMPHVGYWVTVPGCQSSPDVLPNQFGNGRDTWPSKGISSPQKTGHNWSWSSFRCVSGKSGLVFRAFWFAWQVKRRNILRINRPSFGSDKKRLQQHASCGVQSELGWWHLFDQICRCLGVLRKSLGKLGYVTPTWVGEEDG